MGRFSLDPFSNFHVNELTFPTTFGPCRVAWNDVGVTSFHLPGDVLPLQQEVEPPAWILEMVAQVQQHMRGELQDFANARLDFSHCSLFQRAVFQGALAVKPGQTQTYGWLAQQIGHPISASRAVGTALGQNPWPLLVPCHRFVGADGKMVGFSAPGGIQTKLRLLTLEGAQLFSD